MNSTRLIETDSFPFDFVSRLAARESWRKEIHRPIYHVHKWWATRLGSVFRGILLGCVLPEDCDFRIEFYKTHRFSEWTVFDPFMGSGTTIGEAHKLGMTTLGRDVNPVAVDSVRTALGPMDRDALTAAFEQLSEGVGSRIRSLYQSKDFSGRRCDALYFFWVMQVPCAGCHKPVDLFPSWVIARNAYPKRKPEVRILCPKCGEIFPGKYGNQSETCPACRSSFDPRQGTARGTQAKCPACSQVFAILDAVDKLGSRPGFRLYGKLVLAGDGRKEYLRTTADDLQAYECAADRLKRETEEGEIVLPRSGLADGYNTRQALRYRFGVWRDFFNDRQLLALSWLHRAIGEIPHPPTRQLLFTLLSGTLEFNNMFASYKGEGTGAVRHMFAHHILKPERTPIEANVWGTPRSSGGFSTLFRTRLLRAIDYRLRPTELHGDSNTRFVCAPPFSGRVEEGWPRNARPLDRAIYLSCGNSADTGLQDGSVDLVVTDPPFFDNVHYSELADFFYSWQQLSSVAKEAVALTTRSEAEVQDPDAGRFAEKLRSVFRECARILKESGLLVFTYHHSREEGWKALAEAVLGAGFSVINSHPVKAEMSVAMPKTQAKEPIQLDIILVCRKRASTSEPKVDAAKAAETARKKMDRLHAAGLKLSYNDQKIVLFGQLLTTLQSPTEATHFNESQGSFHPIAYPEAPATEQGSFQF